MEVSTRVSFIPHGLWGLLAGKSANSLMVFKNTPESCWRHRVHPSTPLPRDCKEQENARLSGRIVDRVVINALLNSRAGVRAPGAPFRNHTVIKS